MKAASLYIAPGLRAEPVALADAQALARLVQQNIPQLEAYLPQLVEMASSEDDARAHLRHVLDAGAKGELLEWHLFSNDALCGAVRLNHIEASNRKTSIGYWIGARFQGQGIAGASVRAVIGECFNELGFNRIELRCASANVASQKLAERLGFSREGVARQAELLQDDFVDNIVYGLLREEFATGGAARPD